MRQGVGLSAENNAGRYRAGCVAKPASVVLLEQHMGATKSSQRDKSNKMEFPSCRAALYNPDIGI
jgi:hypothetical protein